MASEPQTASTVREPDGVLERVAEWLLFGGDRRAVAACLVVAAAGTVWALVSVGLLAVGPDSSVAGVFGSGLTAGVVTLLTIALSINQLVLSRVFGSINVLVDRLDGSRELRATVESIAGVPSSPNDPGEFLSLIATTLSERAAGLRAPGGDADWDPPARAANTLDDIAAYGDSIDDHLEANQRMNDVLSVVLGPEYALNTAAIRHLRNEHAATIPEGVEAEFRAVDELLESIAVVRQFYKTIAIQQDLATLSRLLVYTGIAALASAVAVTLVYRTGSVTVPVSTLPLVVSVGIGVVVAPLALFVAYILRAATVARKTVSVGPFVPPKDR
ncbi:hypothetical protein GRX01_04220 [Halobaculum sp. WSA2]|uniref:Uncharacterized protein n=1 Tax=Halobaculum saliterrae TaxID=2073113 RepID=A0A6B0SVB1_9EURY|nr:hypothetical protein [Halobaculum saliterrae]MXR40553.1 hypothetical protein [Halobaculum saliterrae]